MFLLSLRCACRTIIPAVCWLQTGKGNKQQHVVNSFQGLAQPRGCLQACLVPTSCNLVDVQCRLWLRPRSLNKSSIKAGSNPKWEGEEAHFGMPVHTRVHQVITVALLDSDAEGDDEIGRQAHRLCRAVNVELETVCGF